MMWAIILAVLLDARMGDPVYSWHPVRLIGLWITKLEKDLYKESSDNTYKFTSGTILVWAVILTVGVIYGAITVLSNTYFPMGAFLIQALLASQLLATRCLWDEGRRILGVIKTGDLTIAQKEIGYLVSRDTAKLSFNDIKKAAVETMTENLTDGIIAPLFYFGLFGLPGLAIYKAINTMDSMIGYKNQRYLYFGRFAARLDDVVNFIPARIAVVLVLVVAMFKGHDAASGWRCFLKHRRFHASPNSGCTEAAMAGVLGIQLSGPTVYFGQVVDRPWIGFKPGDIGENHLESVLGYVVAVGFLGLPLALGLNALIGLL